MNRRTFNFTALLSLFLPIKLSKPKPPFAILVPADKNYPFNKLRLADEQFGPWKRDNPDTVLYREALVILRECTAQSYADICGEALIKEFEGISIGESKSFRVQLAYATPNSERSICGSGVFLCGFY